MMSELWGRLQRPRAAALALVCATTLCAPIESFAVPVGILEITLPSPMTYTEGIDFFTIDSTRNGDVTALVQVVDSVLPPSPFPNTSTSGCEVADFGAFVSGRIAVLQAGTCDFATKGLNAQAAGAAGVIIFHEGQPGRTEALPLDIGPNAITIPMLFVDFALAFDLIPVFGPPDVTVHMSVSGMTTPPVPEPAGVVLLGGALIAVAQRRRRRATQNSPQA
jgi:hypothetical protein